MFLCLSLSFVQDHETLSFKKSDVKRLKKVKKANSGYTIILHINPQFNKKDYRNNRALSAYLMWCLSLSLDILPNTWEK